jgi:hypothetical protein
MAKFLGSTGVSYHLEEMIKNAKEKLVLISPYLKINPKMKLLLEDKDRLKIDVRIIYGKNELLPEENNWLKGLSIRSSYLDNLHAKCYLSESEAIITSMNLYQFSQENNNEMGIYITKIEDEQLYKDIHEEAMRLLRSSTELKVSVEKVAPKPAKATVDKDLGHCISCNASIPVNPEKPYCRDCFSVWKKHEDKEHKESFCHVCGKENPSTLIKPLCYGCYKKLPKAS